MTYQYLFTVWGNVFIYIYRERLNSRGNRWWDIVIVLNFFYGSLLTPVSTTLIKIDHFWKQISCEKIHGKNDAMKQIGGRCCDALIEQTCRAEQRVICPWKKKQQPRTITHERGDSIFYLLMCKWSNRNVARRNKSLFVLEAWGKHGMLSYCLYRQYDGLTEAVCSNRMNNAFLSWFVFPLQT